MSNPTHPLAVALRETARRLAEGDSYRWTDMGRCNCGHLAQTVTGLSPEVIRRQTFQKPGEWSEQAEAFCATSGYPVDAVIDQLLALGMTPTELGQLETLSSPEVIKRLSPERRRSLSYRNREDVIDYMNTWADMVETRR